MQTIDRVRKRLSADEETIRTIAQYVDLADRRLPVDQAIDKLLHELAAMDASTGRAHMAIAIAFDVPWTECKALILTHPAWCGARERAEALDQVLDKLLGQGSCEIDLEGGE